MLGRGQQQDSIFDIIEKGNFFGPASNETVELYDKPKKWKRVLKIGLIVALIVFLIYGLYILFGNTFKNDVFTDKFFNDVVEICDSRAGVVSGDNIKPVIAYLKGLKLTANTEHLRTVNEAGEELYGLDAITFRKSDGTEIMFLRNHLKMSCVSGSNVCSYVLESGNLNEGLIEAFGQTP